MSGYHGHITKTDGTHVALSEDEARAIWDAVEAEKQARATSMPCARDALSAICTAEQRLRDLGWSKGPGLRIRRGDDCAVAEPGSTGIWRGWFDENGTYVHYGDCLTDPRNCWLKPLADLTDDEHSWMERCDRREAEAFTAMLDRAAIAQEHP